MSSDQALLPYRQELSPTDNLRRILRFIVSDGVIAVEEVWYLADWINQNPKTAECWPGTELIPYLQLVWEDGQLNSQEISGLSTLIASIEMEFSKRTPAPPKEDRDALTPDERHSNKSLSLLQLPTANHRARVKSSSGDEEYEIDLSGPTCTCPDWVDRRRKEPQGHPGRACKHIVRTLFDADMAQQASKPLQALLRNCHLRNAGTTPKEEYTIVDSAGQILILSYAGGEWVNVLVPDGEEYERFGYNIDEERWAYGQPPKLARVMCSVIHDTWPEPRSKN